MVLFSKKILGDEDDAREVGLLSSRLFLEGPIWKEHISFFISGRRSYITKPIQPVYSQREVLHQGGITPYCLAEFGSGYRI
jgi:hypothetical protein